MTLGPDLDWLADDEGNLRPQVAQELANAPAPEPMVQPAARPQAARVVEQPAQQLAHDPPRWAVRPLEPPRVTVAMLAAGMLIAALIGFGAGRLPRIADQGPGARPSNEATTTAVLVNGMNVNLRSGPGLEFPIVARMVPDEAVQVRGESAGWYSVTTSTGHGGWIFGAFLRGVQAADQGPAMVTRLLSSDGAPPRVVLRPGDKVLFSRQPDGQTEIVLPTGRRLRVSPDALAPAD